MAATPAMADLLAGRRMSGTAAARAAMAATAARPTPPSLVRSPTPPRWALDLPSPPLYRWWAGRRCWLSPTAGRAGNGRGTINTIIGDGGDGGLAGAGGSASLTLGQFHRHRDRASGGPVHARRGGAKHGGGGGSGGSTSLNLVCVGGTGNTGGDGGAVTITSDRALVRVGDISGPGSSAVVAQSIGGGGGSGGNAVGEFGRRWLRDRRQRRAGRQRRPGHDQPGAE